MTKLSKFAGGVYFWCPGCNMAHGIKTGENGWEFNGSFEAPTFSPSVLVRGGTRAICCHSFVRNGFIQFLGDSNHGLAGQTVELPDWPLGAS